MNFDLLLFTLLCKHVILLHYYDVSDRLFAINRLVTVCYKLSLLLFPEWVDLPPVPTVTPLHPDQFAQELCFHPDQAQVSYVVEGLRDGFKLGFDDRCSLKSAKRNKATAFKHPKVIDDYLCNETKLGRVAGLFTTPPICHLHISSFGIIPKKGQLGK